MAALPRKLKNMNLSQDGGSFLGQIASVTLPPITRKTEEWRGGGMVGAVKADMGLEAMTMEWTLGGWAPEVLSKIADPKIGGSLLRFAGALQREDTGAVNSVEVVVRGRHNEIGRGESKPGEDTEMSVKTDLTYYAEFWDGVEVYAVDFINGVERVRGVDRQAAIRKAIGA